MDRSPHCALSGDGALEFARKEGFPICDPEELKGDYPNQQVAVDDQEFNPFVHNVDQESSNEDSDNRPAYTGEWVPESLNYPLKHDTVSAVAMDKNGYFACAMSTGGIHGKLKGRVSDASLVGCGGYANEFGAAATTGHGESIMKMTLAREVVYNMERGDNAQEAAEKALRRMKTRVKGHGGVIAIDRQGNFGKACSTAVMVWASQKNDDELVKCEMMERTIF